MPLELHPQNVGRPLHEILKDAGITGAGGAGFPTWVKYEAPQPTLLVNAQESEPGYFIDKWLHVEKAAELLDLLAWMRGWGVTRCVVGAKLKDRPSFEAMEKLAGVDSGGARMLDCTGRNRHVLADQPEPVLFAYTDDKYPFGMETALLLIVAQQKVPQGQRPNQHGYIVSNTETLWNVYKALTSSTPVTEKYVHVYGATPRHTFREVPVGTPASVVLADAGLSLEEIAARGLVIVDGGPGWYDVVDPATAVVRRRTNALLALDPTVVDLTKKDVLPGPNRVGYPLPETVFSTAPSSLPTPPSVRLPLVDNPKFAAVGVVAPALPSVAVGQHVEVGAVVATAGEGISLPVHASIKGTISAVDETFVEITAA